MIKDLGNHRYRFYVSIGGRSDRQRFSRTVTHKGGKKELKKLYDDFVKECVDTPATEVTVQDLLESYIAYCRTLGRKATTLKGYKIAAERLYPSVETILARSLTTYRLEKIVAQMTQNGSSAKSIKNSISLLSAAYRHAIRIGQLKDNPCERLTLPKIEPREIRIFTLDEIQPFLDAIADVDLNEKVAYELALFMGLRRSEILGLKESDADIVSGMIDIHTTRHRVDGEDITADTKTKRSARTLAMPDILLIDIARLLQVHRDFKYEKTDWLVQDGFGNPLSPQALSSRLVRLEEAKGLPRVTIHGLRHTFASLLHSKGVDMAQISAELGHGNLTTTQNVYMHIIKSPSQSSRGIASTINTFVDSEKACQIGDKSENEKASER